MIDQLKNGIKNTEICLPTKIEPLRDTTLQYCVIAVDFLNKKANKEKYVLGIKS